MRRSWLRTRLRRNVYVHTTQSTTIRGVLQTVGGDGVVLSAAVFLESADPVPMAGDVFIPKANVAFIQIEGNPT